LFLGRPAVAGLETRKPFFRSAPSKYLALAILAVAIVTLLLPYTPLAELFEFVPLPLSFYGMIGGILVLYILSVEIAKKIFYRRLLNHKS